MVAIPTQVMESMCMETNTHTSVHYYGKAYEIAQNLNGRDIISVIAVLGGFTYAEVANAVAGQSENIVIAMLATQLQLAETKVAEVKAGK